MLGREEKSVSFICESQKGLISPISNRAVVPDENERSEVHQGDKQRGYQDTGLTGLPWFKEVR